MEFFQAFLHISWDGRSITLPLLCSKLVNDFPSHRRKSPTSSWRKQIHCGLALAHISKPFAQACYQLLLYSALESCILAVLTCPFPPATMQQPVSGCRAICWGVFPHACHPRPPNTHLMPCRAQHTNSRKPFLNHCSPPCTGSPDHSFRRALPLMGGALPVVLCLQSVLQCG